MSNLFSIGGAGNVGFSGGVTQQSLKFNDDESQYLSWTPAAAGNQRTWTWSGWVKRGKISGSGYSVLFGAGDINNNDQLLFRMTSDEGQLFWRHEVSGVARAKQNSIALFRDPSAWYHIVLAYDSTNATAADRIKIYVNGVRIELDNDDAIELNRETKTNSVTEHHIGYAPQVSDYFDGYMSDIHFIDGQALDADDFGETVDGYWKAKDYAGTYGTNGFRLTFADDVVSEGFNTVTYLGNGGTQSISGLGFEPDLVWVKERSSTSGHALHDSVRGAGKYLGSHSANAEATSSTQVTSFDADGFTTGASGQTNQSSQTYVAWGWDAGSGSAASNTDGSITSTVKANPSYGFSIVSYTGNGTDGATIGHSLGVEPDFIITKERSNAEAWCVYHQSIDNNNYHLRLNQTDGLIAATTVHKGVSASTYTVGTSGLVNTSGDTFIAYCFAEVAGYSSFGSYSGNGSTTGPTVTTGFAPAFVMYKKTNGTGSWIMQDNTRSPVNPVDKFVYANESDAEYSGSRDVDFLSDGFQIKSDAVNINQSGRDYIYMAFADTREAAFWKDVSGQGNHWTPNNLDYRDSLIDSPANNFAVLNATFATSNSASTGGTLSEGNLRITTTGGFFKGGTFAPSSGKWYFEGYAESVGAQMSISFADYSAIQTGYSYIGYLSGGGLHEIDGTAQDSAGTHATWTAGDIISVAVDIDAGKIWWAKNGTYIDSGDPAAGTNAPTTFTAGTEVVPYFMCDNASGTKTWRANFGQDSTFSGATTAGGNQDDNGIGDFKYAPPAGYLALCSANLPTPTIVDGSEYFNTVLYTGTGVARSITGVGFQPDWVWVKERSSTSGHILFDSVRGVLKFLQAQDTSSEITDAEQLSSFDSDGWSVGASTGINQSGVTNVAWNWKAGGTAVSNTDGSITSQVSANTTAGFSIVSYTGNGVTGATVGHSLGVKPDMFIVKNRTNSGVNDWSVYHSSLTATHRAYLYKTDAAGSTSAWNNTEPTSSVFTLKNFGELNSSGDNYIAYCFANTDGYLKAGSYTGNGNNDGPFVYTGFRPAWVMWKNASSSEHWIVLDAERDPHNYVENKLYPSGTFVDQTSANTKVDYLSNGFKIRGTENEFNQSGNLIIYLAFAENPFKYANAR